MDYFIIYGGPITFIGVQISSLLTGYKIYQERNVGNLSIIPFFTLFINCVVWGIYGFLINAFPVYGPNLTGALIGFICTLIYQRYSLNKDYTLFGLGGIIIFISLYATYLGYPSAVGAIGSCLSVAVMGSPLSVVTTVITERSTSAMPFYTSFLMWISSLSWTLYGYTKLNDPLVYVPNILGLILSSIQMLLFVIYGLPNNNIKRGGATLPY